MRRRSQHEHHHRSQNLRPAFPYVQHVVGLGRDEQGPRLSSAYVVITTDADDGLSGGGFVFTVGRGNDVVVAGIDSLSRMLVGRNVENLLDDMRAAWDMFVHDSQLRWLGPEEGVEHMAIGAVLSAPSTRSRPPPASRCRTASCTSSICRRAASRSCRSTPRASPGRRRSCSNTCSPTSSACACAPPHAGGVGLCEVVRHFAMFDYLAISGQWDDRVIEYVDNQHEYFVHPTEIVNGRYKAPTAPGSGVDMKLEAAERYLYKG